MKCPDCGKENPETVDFCEVCGAGLGRRLPVKSEPCLPPAESPPPEIPKTAPEEAIYCPSCGKRNPLSADFCLICGAKLLGEEETAPISAPPPKTEKSLPAAWLVSSEGKEFPLSCDRVIIGRKSPVEGFYPDIDLSELDTGSFISRRHAIIAYSEGGFVLKDLGSVNKSFVNESQLLPSEVYPIKDGDKIKLGKLEFTFKAE